MKFRLQELLQVGDIRNDFHCSPCGRVLPRISIRSAPILQPRGMQWFQPKTAIDAINEDQARKRWLENAGAVMRRAMYDRAGQFTRATKEGDADCILFGRCVIEPRVNAQRTGLLYRTSHLRDCVWAESAKLALPRMHNRTLWWW